MVTIFGFAVPSYVLWILGGVLVLGIIGFILKGFISEIRKK